jgi:hypothetical protein
MANRQTKNRNSKKTKVLRSYRLDRSLVRTLQELASDQGKDETWVVETILGVSLGLREMPKPFVLPVSLKDAA